MRHARRALMCSIDSLHCIYTVREKADFRNIILLTKRMRVADDTTTGMYQFILFFHICVFDLGMFKQPFFV